MTSSSADAGVPSRRRGARSRDARSPGAARAAGGRGDALRIGLVLSAVLHAAAFDAVAFPRAPARRAAARSAGALTLLDLPPRVEVPEAPAPIPGPLPPRASRVDVPEPVAHRRETAVPEPPSPAPRPPEVRAATLEGRPTQARADVPPMLEAPDEIRRQLRRHYPRTLERRGIGGVVELRLYVDERGRVSRARVAESSGHGRLDRAAREMASEMSFLPALVRDRAVGIWVSQRICFTFVEEHEGDPALARCERQAAPGRR